MPKIGFKHSEETKRKMRKNHADFKGSKSPSWKGGKLIHSGYICIWKPNHPFKNALGYVKRSRLVMEKKLGRFLNPIERVHHKNKIRNDDRIENLKLFPNASKHTFFHHPKGSKWGINKLSISS